MIVFCSIILLFAIVCGLSLQFLTRYRSQTYIEWTPIILSFWCFLSLTRKAHVHRVPGATRGRARHCVDQHPVPDPCVVSFALKRRAHACFLRLIRCSVQVRLPSSLAEAYLLLTTVRKAGGSSSTARSCRRRCSTSLWRAEPRSLYTTPTTPTRNCSYLCVMGFARLILPVTLGISGAGLLSCVLMGEIPLLTDSLDEMCGFWEDAGREKATGDVGGGKVVDEGYSNVVVSKV
ncbi:hypothetical protein BD413DRAFT_583060 [Trametes elegans]|nr:hypothetical protein BD413DRAFT_583060 [Trametes elegans]